MSTLPQRPPHALVHLFPQFLGRRRRGFPGLTPILDELGMPRPLYFMLAQSAQMPPAGATTADLRPGTPYATRDSHLPLLAGGIARDLLVCDEQGRYRPSEQGWALLARVEGETTAWLSRQVPLPAPELNHLASEFGALAAGLPRAGEATEAHIHRWGRMAALAPQLAGAPLVRLERALMDLWMARNDAHIAAWDMARFYGPHLDVLTRLWRGDAEDLAGLQALMAATQDAETVAAIVEELTEQGYLEIRQGVLQPTRAGYNVREEIESNTDELYFAQWPHLDGETIAWLHDTLGRLIAALPSAPVVVGDGTS